MNRRIGWRLYTLLNAKERALIEGLLIVEPENKQTLDMVEEIRARVRSERRIIFCTPDRQGKLIEYTSYAGREDMIPAERLLWTFFPGTLDERGGMVPKIIDVCWTEQIVVALVRVDTVRSMLFTDGNVETEIHAKPRARTIGEVLNDGNYMEPVGKVLAPVANELATALMMKR